MTRMYVLKSSSAPWGDYGDMLRHGIVHEESNDERPLVIHRAGQAIPPISFPWPTIVITQDLGTQLEAERFSGYELRPVSVGKVVAIDWTAWDQTAPEPAKYPAGGEPENYILKRKHSPEAAAQLPQLHELHVPSTSGLQLEGGKFVQAAYRGTDIARSHPRFSYIYVTERFAQWLMRHVPTWVALEDVAYAA